MLCIKNYDCEMPQLMRSPAIMFTTYLKIKWRWIKVKRKEDFPLHGCYYICFSKLHVIRILFAIYLDRRSPYTWCDFYLCCPLWVIHGAATPRGEAKSEPWEDSREWAQVSSQALVVRETPSYAFFSGGLGPTLGWACSSGQPSEGREGGQPLMPEGQGFLMPAD